MPQTLTYVTVGLLALAALAFVPAASATGPVLGDCNGVVVGSQFTGFCIVHDCAASPSGTGIVFYDRGVPGRCVGL